MTITKRKPGANIFDIDATNETGLLLTVKLLDERPMLQISCMVMDLYADMSDRGSNVYDVIRDVAERGDTEYLVQKMAKPIWFDFETSRDKTKQNISKLISDEETLDSILDEINGYTDEWPKVEDFTACVANAVKQYCPSLLTDVDEIVEIEYGYNPFVRKLVSVTLDALREAV